jgi:hypothetical protein
MTIIKWSWFKKSNDRKNNIRYQCTPDPYLIRLAQQAMPLLHWMEGHSGKLDLISMSRGSYIGILYLLDATTSISIKKISKMSYYFRI